jgi:hypothetical protein
VLGVGATVARLWPSNPRSAYRSEFSATVSYPARSAPSIASPRRLRTERSVGPVGRATMEPGRNAAKGA